MYYFLSKNNGCSFNTFLPFGVITRIRTWRGAWLGQIGSVPSIRVAEGLMTSRHLPRPRNRYVGGRRSSLP